MKKTYITPDMEVKTFNVEEIMTASSAVVDGSKHFADGAADAVKDVSYNELFGLN